MLAEYAAQAGVDVGVLRGWDGSHLAEEVAPTAYYRWMYRTIQGAMFDEVEAAAGAAQAQEKFEAWHKTIVSENAFPKLLANAESPWWDDVRTDAVETASDIVARAWTDARADLTRA